MKRKFCSLSVIVIMLFATACNAGHTSAVTDAENTSQEVKDIDDKVEKNDIESEKSTQKPDAESSEADEEVDVDLTQLSSTMVYSEVYNMMVMPNDYIGKTVKMKGQFVVYQDQSTGKNYYAVIIADATACCSQGLEFVLAGNYNYPDDYPEQGMEITVAGEFQIYKEGDYSYCYLINAEIV